MRGMAGGESKKRVAKANVEAAPPTDGVPLATANIGRRRDQLFGRYDYEDSAKQWVNAGQEKLKKKAIREAERLSQKREWEKSDSSSDSDEERRKDADFNEMMSREETVRGYEEFGNRHKLDR